VRTIFKRLPVSTPSNRNIFQLGSFLNNNSKTGIQTPVPPYFTIKSNSKVYGLTVPILTCAAGLGVGFNCTILQGGAGKVTVAAGGQTLVSYSSLFSTMGQYAVISLVCPVANTFVAAGNLGV